MYKFAILLSALALSACVAGPSTNSFRDVSVTPQVASVPIGMTLPYGEISQACNVSKSAMGKSIAQFPENRGKYQVYDTKPGSASPRTFYITGFSDGCARQFTASLAVFGSVENYESIRYSAAGKTLPISTTDKAYEQLKGRVCNVSPGAPCGSRMNAMARDTVFLTVYKNFGSNNGWMNLLISGGKVIAMDRKQG